MTTSLRDSGVNLTTEQKDLLVHVVNSFGTGEHPLADINTIPDFKVQYLFELCQTAMEYQHTDKQTVIDLRAIRRLLK